MVLADGLTVVGGGVALFPRQRPLGLVILRHAGDIDAAFAQTLAAGQTARLVHHNGGVLWGHAEDRRALQPPETPGPRLLPRAPRTPLLRCEDGILPQEPHGGDGGISGTGDPLGLGTAIQDPALNEPHSCRIVKPHCIS